MGEYEEDLSLLKHIHHRWRPGETVELTGM